MLRAGFGSGDARVTFVRLVAEWRRADEVAARMRLAPVYELHPLEHVAGVTDDPARPVAFRA